MGVPKHLKIVFRGIFDGTEETWSFGTHWSFTSDGAADPTLTDVDETGVSTALTTLMAGTGTAAFGTHVKATEWRAYEIGVDNRMVGNPLIVILPAPVAGSGSRQFPPQCALAITTVADNRGPARFGRFYLPCPSVDLVNSQMPDTVTANWHALVTAFVKSVSDQVNMPVPGQSSTMLNISERPAPGGSKQEVDHLEVGRVIDTLRTRRKSLDEDRLSGGSIDW